MKKPCWIFRFIDDTECSTKRSWGNFKEHFADILVDILLAILYGIAKIIEHFDEILLSLIGLLLTYIGALLLGTPLARYILGNTATNAVFYVHNFHASTFLLELKIAGLGVMPLIILALIAYCLYKIIKHGVIYYKRNMLATRLWKRHERHVVNN